MFKLVHGDCLERMKELASNSVDAVVTDPPYGIGFMGKQWDKGVPSVEFWVEMLRVLKPGGHLLAFSGTRTYHRMAVAIEDAGFEVRDMIEWVYGSGFPKSLNIGKAVDKLQGTEYPKNTLVSENGSMSGGNYTRNTIDVQSEVAKQWEGWGTALKPAHEPICMARKPLAAKTVAENCLKWGTGGINIDESRVSTEDNLNGGAYSNNREISTNKVYGEYKRIEEDYQQPQGRFPANLIHDNSEEVRECFPETGKSTGGIIGNKGSALNMMGQDYEAGDPGYGDSGNASRFFKSIIYQAKASKSERNKGCEGLEEKQTKGGGGFTSPQNEAGDFIVSGDKRTAGKYGSIKAKATNNHPTVKPVALMEYLINMVSRDGATILDPFMGSGTTGVACKNLGRNFIGIELDADYIEIARARIEAEAARDGLCSNY